MEVRDFFLKFEITKCEPGDYPCGCCECSLIECGQFPCCPLPGDYFFKIRKEYIEEFKHHEQRVSYRHPAVHLLCIGVLFRHFNFSLVDMRILVDFGNVEAFGEDARLWSLFNGHMLVYRARHRFHWLVEIR